MQCTHAGATPRAPARIAVIAGIFRMLVYCWHSNFNYNIFVFDTETHTALWLDDKLNDVSELVRARIRIEGHQLQNCFLQFMCVCVCVQIPFVIT